MAPQADNLTQESKLASNEDVPFIFQLLLSPAVAASRLDRRNWKYIHQD